MVPINEENIIRAIEASNALPDLADLLLPGISIVNDLILKIPNNVLRMRCCTEIDP
jgi:hypothetical protein